MKIKKDNVEDGLPR